MSVNKIIKSYKKFLDDISDLTAFVYTDSSINLDETLTARVETDLVGTETSFIIEANIEGDWYKFINPTDAYNPLHKFIKITLPISGETKYYGITALNEATGQITIDSTFGEAVTTTDTFEIVVLDSIYLFHDTNRSVGGQSRFNQRMVRINMTIKTKEDASKVKNRNYQEYILGETGKYANAIIYDDNLITELGNMNFEHDTLTFNETIDSADQLVKFLGTMRVNYYMNNFG